MAVIDDVKKLSEEDVLYLTRAFQPGPVPTMNEVYRGRLRQALKGNWVFNSSTGANGVVGFDLGQVDGNWASSETPAAGPTVTVQFLLAPGLAEVITLTTVIPTDFAD
jgi:hypothetical protein